MKNFINFTILSTLTSIGTVIVLVLLIDSLVLAAISAGFVLFVHTLALIAYGYWEIRNEVLVDMRREVMADLGIGRNR